MPVKNGHDDRAGLPAIDLALMRMKIRLWFKAGIKVYCILTAIVLACCSCRHPLPELNPAAYVSTAPGKAYEVSNEVKPDSLPAERPAGIPVELRATSGKLALAQLVDVALRINPSTQAAWEGARAAAAAWASARGDYYPSISASVDGTGGKFSQTVGADQFTGISGQADISISYLLLDFGGRDATVEAARQALAAANWNHNQAIQDVLCDVPQAYYTYVGDKAGLEASKISLKEAEESLLSTEQRRKAGVSTIADVLQARANLDQVRFDLVTDIGAVEISRGDLAASIGWPANTPFEVVDEPDALPLDRITQDAEKLVKLALYDRPDLASARANVRQRKAEFLQAEAALWPQLTATGDTGWSGYNGRVGGIDIDGNGTDYTVGLSLQIPIFEGYSLRNDVREARASLDEARAQLRGKEVSVISDVWTAYYNLRTASQQLETSETLLASSKESYRVSLARYRAGAADIVELLNAQSTLASARAQRVNARTGLFTSYAELMHAIGAELPSAVSTHPSGLTR